MKFVKQLINPARYIGRAVAACLVFGQVVPVAVAAEASATKSAALGAVAVAIATFIVAMTVVAAVMLWLTRRRRLARIEGEAQQLHRNVDRMDALLRTAPMAHAVLDTKSLELSPSSQLVSLLECPGGLGSMDGMAAVFEADDAAALRHACRKLVETATELNLQVKTAKSDRTFSVTGAVAKVDDGQPIVWFRETSRERTALTTAEETGRGFEIDRDRLSQILDNLPMPVWLRNSDLSLAWVNSAHRVAVEAGVDASPADLDMELVPGLAAEEAQSLSRRAVALQESQVENRRFVVGGDRKSFELVEIPLKTGEVVGFAHDMTARDDAVGELERFSEANVEVFNHLQSAVAIFDAERQLTFRNDAFIRLWEFDEAWLDAHQGHDEILENLRQRRRLPEQIDFQAYKNAVLEQYTALLESHEEMEVLPDGTMIRSVLSPYPLGGLMIIYDDVTDRLELERARNTTQAVQGAILDHLLEGLAVFGSDGRLKLFNARFSGIWDLSKDFLESEPHVSDVIESCRGLIFDTSLQASEWRPLKDRIIENALERSSRMSRLLLTDGRSIRCSGVPLPDGAMLYTYVEVGQQSAGDDTFEASGMKRDLSHTPAQQT